MAKKRRATFRVTRELLENMFRLPTGTTLVDVRLDHFCDEFEFLMDGPDFPELEEAQLPPMRRPSYEKITGESYKFIGWKS